MLGNIYQIPYTRSLTACFIALLMTGIAAAQVKMPAIFGDHMVLQREQKIPVWGTAVPGEKIKVALGNSHAKTRADA